MANFDDDYFRQLLERMEVVEGEQLERAFEEHEDTLEHVDRAIARRMRPEPELLRLTPDRDVLATADSLKDRLDDLYELRTELCRRLERADLDKQTVLLLMRSILAGIQHDIAHYHEPSRPARYLADLLRQERIGRLLDASEIVEAWRVLFELQIDRGEWALAEDYIFHAVELADDPDDLVDRGVDVFQELLSLSDEKLEKGRLTRSEVERARWDLLEMVDARIDDD